MITSMGKGFYELLAELIVVCLFLCDITQIVMNGLGGNLMERSKVVLWRPHVILVMIWVNEQRKHHNSCSMIDNYDVFAFKTFIKLKQ